jgi:hypothetical protein
MFRGLHDKMKTSIRASHSSLVQNSHRFFGYVSIREKYEAKAFAFSRGCVEHHFRGNWVKLPKNAQQVSIGNFSWQLGDKDVGTSSSLRVAHSPVKSGGAATTMKTTLTGQSQGGDSNVLENLKETTIWQIAAYKQK